MKLLPPRFVCTVALLFLAAACAPAPATPPDTSAQDRAAIDAVRDAWVAGYNAADADALANLFTEDAIAMPAEQPTITGRAAIRQHYADTFAAGKGTASVTPQETQLMGDWAYDLGTFSGTFTPAAGGDAMSVEGRYIVVLQRQTDGSWKIARDIDNSATPPVGSEGGGAE